MSAMNELQPPRKQQKLGSMDAIGMLKARIEDMKTERAAAAEERAAAAAAAAEAAAAALKAVAEADNDVKIGLLRSELEHYRGQEKHLQEKAEQLQEQLNKKVDQLEGLLLSATAADDSGSFLEPILNEDRTLVPPDYEALLEPLPFLSAPLPILPQMYLEASTQCGNQSRLKDLAAPSAETVVRLAVVVCACIPNGGNGAGENSVVIDSEALVLRPMRLGLKSLGQTFHCAFDNIDASGATEAQKRPDAQLFLRDVLVFKVEAKASENDFSQAVDELQNKMAEWQAAYHGDRKYILCCAIAGTRLRFYAVTCGGAQCKPISREFHTDEVLDRLGIMHTALRCVNILLRQLEHQMPLEPLPLGRIVKKGAASISYNAHHVEKSVYWPLFDNKDDLPNLRKVYKHIIALPNDPGLGHPRGILKPRRKPEKKKNFWRVEMPLCTWKKPGTEAALNSLVADVLHGLDALHVAGFVHRDVRRPNILQVEEGSYVLIDFELSGFANRVPPFPALRHWPKECQEGNYAPWADVHSLGRLMGEYGFVLSPSALRFSNMLQHDKLTAKKALELLWTPP